MVQVEVPVASDTLTLCQKSSGLNKGHAWQSVAISGNQWQSVRSLQEKRATLDNQGRQIECRGWWGAA